MKPISLKTHEVRAILDGRKTQMRRPVKNPHLILLQAGFTPEYVASEGNYPPYKVGDVLYVRETWWQVYENETDTCIVGYKAGGSQDFYGQDRVAWSEVYDYRNPERTRPSVHMPKWAARLFLKVTSVRLERVQDINGMDAKREGVSIPSHLPEDGADLDHARREFLSLYQSIYGNVDDNPWVWVVEFKRIEKPEDV